MQAHRTLVTWQTQSKENYPNIRVVTHKRPRCEPPSCFSCTAALLLPPLGPCPQRHPSARAARARPSSTTPCRAPVITPSSTCPSCRRTPARREDCTSAREHMMNLSALDESQLFDSPSALALEARMGSPPLPLSLFPSTSPLAPPLPRHITTTPRALSLSRSIAFPRISHTFLRLPLLFAPPSPPSARPQLVRVLQHRLAGCGAQGLGRENESVRAPADARQPARRELRPAALQAQVARAQNVVLRGAVSFCTPRPPTLHATALTPLTPQMLVLTHIRSSLAPFDPLVSLAYAPLVKPPLLAPFTLPSPFPTRPAPHPPPPQHFIHCTPAPRPRTPLTPCSTAEKSS